MTKQQKHEIIKQAIFRLHFHRTVSEQTDKEQHMIHALMAFAHNIQRAESIENLQLEKKEVTAAYDLAYETLQRETI